MSGWVCSNCKKHFEGGFFNTRNCPRCFSYARDIFRLVMTLLKIALVAAPVLIVLNFFSKPIFDGIINTVRNSANLTTAIYYHPAVYFNNLIFNKTDSYYELLENKQGFIKMNSLVIPGFSAPDLMITTGQNVVLKGIIRQGNKIWMAVEFYAKEKRERCFILSGKDWEQGFGRIDFESLLNQAKENFKNAVLTSVSYKEIDGKDNIKKFSEENEEYFRLDIEDKSVFKPLLSFFSPQYEAAYFINKSDQGKVDGLRKKFMDKNEIEKKLLQIKY